MQKVLRSKWGRLFQNWENAKPDHRGYSDFGPGVPELTRGTLRLLGMSLRILATCLKEAPEVAARRRRRTRSDAPDD